MSSAAASTQQNYEAYSTQNGPYATSNIYTTAASTITTSIDAQNANYNQQQKPPSQTKLTKQATSIYDPPDEYYDANNYDQEDFFNEEDEEQYIREHQHSPDNYDSYIDNNNYNNRRSSKLERNDTNNNEGYEYGYENERKGDDYYGEH